MIDNTKIIEKLHKQDPKAREMLVENNMGLVAGIAKRFYNRGYDVEELIQVGAIGLIKAVEKFDMTYNVQFSTYAVPLIMGEIKRFIRDDGIIKVSRVHKTNAMKANIAKERLSQRLNRSPTIKELSDECGIGEDELIEAMEATARLESIYQTTPNDGDDRELIDRLTTELEEEEIINRVLIKEGLCVLTPRERKIIALRYFFDKTQSYIASVIGVSQVQISRIEKAALEKMKMFLLEGQAIKK